MSRETSIRTITAIVFGLLLASRQAGAQSSTNFKLVPGVASAGGRASSTNFKLSSDVGRSAGGARSASANFDLVGGFTGGAFSNVATATVNTAGGAYSSVTFPIRSMNQAVGTVLSEFGSYDATKWRIGHFSPVDSAYMEPGSSGSLSLTTLAPGQGYWLITKNSSAGTATGTPAPPTAFNIALTAGPGTPARPAWNQVGNPFLFPIAVSDLQVTDGVTTVALTNVTNTFTEIVAKTFDGSGYVDATTIDGRTAFWVRRKAATGSITLIVPYKSSATGNPGPQLVAPEGADWMVAVTARQGDRKAEALKIGATRLLTGPGSPLNSSAAPAPPGMDLLRLHMPKTDWGMDNGDYVGEFQAMAPRMSWEFVLSGAEAPGEVALDLSSVRTPEGLSFRLVDVASGQVRELAPGRSTIVPASADDRRYRIEVTSGGATPATSTASTGFDIAYPNPFRTSVGLHFSIARSADIGVDVYDLQGRLVRSIEQPAAAAGEHVLVWDGRDAAGHGVESGVYLARYKAGSLTGIRRVVKID